MKAGKQFLGNIFWSFKIIVKISEVPPSTQSSKRLKIKMTFKQPCQCHWLTQKRKRAVNSWNSTLLVCLLCNKIKTLKFREAFKLVLLIYIHNKVNYTRFLLHNWNYCFLSRISVKCEISKGYSCWYIQSLWSCVFL